MDWIPEVHLPVSVKTRSHDIRHAVILALIAGDLQDNLQGEGEGVPQ